MQKRDPFPQFITHKLLTFLKTHGKLIFHTNMTKLHFKENVCGHTAKTALELLKQRAQSVNWASKISQSQIWLSTWEMPKKNMIQQHLGSDLIKDSYSRLHNVLECSCGVQHQGVGGGSFESCGLKVGASMHFVHHIQSNWDLGISVNLTEGSLSLSHSC